MVKRPGEGFEPIGVLGSTAASLEKNVNRSLGIFIYIIATLAAFTVAVLIGLVVLQLHQNDNINKTLKGLNSIAISNHSIATDNATNTTKFGAAVEDLRKQLNGIRATDNETLYRVKQLEQSVLGYVPSVPNSVLQAGQVSVAFNPGPTPSPSPQQSPTPRSNTPTSTHSQPPRHNPAPKPSPQPSKKPGIVPSLPPLPIPLPPIP